MIEKYIELGISTNMLFHYAQDDRAHLAGIKRGCAMQEYSALDLSLPLTEPYRSEAIKAIKDAGKAINYNMPGLYQSEEYDPGSADAAMMAKTIDYVKMHIDYAGACGAKLLVLPSCRALEQSAWAQREESFFGFAGKMADHAKQYGITIAMEPIERHRFKRLLFGPTVESAAFISRMQAAGHKNMTLMMDIAHLPLMEETLEQALEASKATGLTHVHIGNMVIDERSEFYGHMHPAVGVQYGEFWYADLVSQLKALKDFGYMDKATAWSKPSISYEVRAYPGVSEETSARAMYEMVDNAFQAIWS